MTTIIGITHPTGVLMAADRAALLGTQRETLTEPKIIQFNNVLIGVAGTLLVRQALEAYLKDPWFRHRDMTIGQASGIISVVVQKRLVGQLDGIAPEFLVAVRGKLYTVLSDGTYLEAQRGYAAIGSGADYALGALRVYSGDGVWSLTTSQMRAEKALEIAAEFDSGTAAPFDFIGLGNESGVAT